MKNSDYFRREKFVVLRVYYFHYFILHFLNNLLLNYVYVLHVLVLTTKFLYHRQVYNFNLFAYIVHTRCEGMSVLCLHINFISLASVNHRHEFESQIFA